jgi:hypothetical protein
VKKKQRRKWGLFRLSHPVPHRPCPTSSRFSCTLLPGVPEVFDYAEPASCSRITRLTVLPSRRQKGVGTRLHIFGAQILPPASSPVYASLWLLAGPQARLGTGMKSLLLFRRALIPYNVPVYPGAL